MKTNFPSLSMPRADGSTISPGPVAMRDNSAPPPGVAAPEAGAEADDLPSHMAFHVGRPADPIQRLPGGTPRDKLRALRDRLAESRAYLRAIGNEWEEKRQERMSAEHDLLMLTDRAYANRRGGQGRTPADDPEAIRRRSKVDRASKDLDEITTRREAVQQRVQRLGRIVENAERFLIGLPAGTALGIAEEMKGRRIHPDQIEASIAELRADLHEIRSAPYPVGDAKAAVRAEIDRLAEAGTPDVSRLLDHGPDDGIVWPQMVHVFNPFGERPTELSPGIALAAFLFRDQLAEALEREIDRIAEGEVGALSAEDRRAKIEKVQSDILLLERAEAAAVWANGDPGDLREDIDPRAVLGIDVAQAT